MPDFSHFPRHRLDALVDAVLAITMTLLVLELRLPEAEGAGLLAGLDALEPKLISWVVSFLILAFFWSAHTRAFQRVERIDNRLFWLVTPWLLATSFVPFTSSLIGEHNELPESHAIYATNLIAVQAVLILRNLYLHAHPELLGEGGAHPSQVGWAGVAVVVLCALGSVVWAYRFGPNYASLAYVLIWPLSMAARRLGGAKA